MAAGTSFLRLYAVLLGFSLVFSSFNAIPITRTTNLMAQKSLGGQKVSGNTHLVNMKETLEFKGRMNLELHDYPGSGANNRHTPRP